MIKSGQNFGLYVIKEVIKSDDLVICCRADDPFFDREVTLKLYPVDFFAENKRPQLEELLEALAILDHPSIAPLYDSGIEDAYAYFTSAYNSGGSLAEQLVAPFSEEQALKITAELVQAVAYASELGFAPGALSAEKVYFDPEGLAVWTDFGIDISISRCIATAEEVSGESRQSSDSAAETFQDIGKLLLAMLLGYEPEGGEPLGDLLNKVENSHVRKLLGRLLSPDELPFASYAELLEELSGRNDMASPVTSAPPASDEAEPGVHHQVKKTVADEQTEQMIREVRRMVAEKNSLQNTLDKTIYERNLAENKTTESERQLALAKKEIARVQEEANVAWELIAGHKYARWRPIAWAVGGFALGFLLSGSYGYYYSEQTRNELLAKLQANEELIKTAAWRGAEESVSQDVLVNRQKAESRQPDIMTVAESEPGGEQALLTEVEVTAVEEEQAQKWWPFGQEFSPIAAIPVEQLKAALEFESLNVNGDLSELLQEEILRMINVWAESWAKQDLSGYFSCYSENFRPELGRSLEEWREMRLSRVTRPDWIKLEVNDIRVRQIEEGRVQVKLKQHYRSDFYQDQILKSINLIKEEGRWRILMERSLGMIGDIKIVSG
ncbi:MAG: hypothetical protein KAT62_06495 [Desulfuromonadales bacterium]|nr:hypothetical protein [Desulfuromonadales bacterium]